MTVSGAYGRDYRNLEEMRYDWEAGKDFVVRSVDAGIGPGGVGSYCSKRDFTGKEVWGRYRKDTRSGLLQRGARVELRP